MNFLKTFIKTCILVYFGLNSISSRSQQVNNVPETFAGILSEPEIIHIDNSIEVPTEEGHFQGVQTIKIGTSEKLLISGSSRKIAYILQIDLAERKTDKLIPLMKSPYRHAGGFQVSRPYLAIGVEDNFTKTTSKVCLYNYLDANLYKKIPNMMIDRKGIVEKQTAGATGILAVKDRYLAVVANWDSRNWDFYHINPAKNEWRFLESFTAPDDWPYYQSINLIKDDNAIYALGFYQKEAFGQADLILISERGPFKSILKKMGTKEFRCSEGTDFSAAAGLQVDHDGKLYIWATQRKAGSEITINRFSQK